jgi:hypothetical protein
MFGLFENKQAKQCIASFNHALNSADNLSQGNKKKIALYILKIQIKFIKEIEGLPVPSPEVDKIMKAQMYWATNMRQKSVSKKEDKDPKWVQFALLESFLQGNSMVFGRKTFEHVCGGVNNWIQQNLSEKEFKKIVG